MCTPRWCSRGGLQARERDGSSRATVKITSDYRAILQGPCGNFAAGGRPQPIRTHPENARQPANSWSRTSLDLSEIASGFGKTCRLSRRAGPNYIVKGKHTFVMADLDELSFLTRFLVKLYNESRAVLKVFRTRLYCTRASSVWGLVRGSPLACLA